MNYVPNKPVQIMPSSTDIPNNSVNVKHCKIILLVLCVLTIPLDTQAQGFSVFWNTWPNTTNGTYLKGSLVLSGNTLYGTARDAGPYGYGPPGGEGYGTVFAIHTDGTDITNLHSFTAVNPINYKNGDGEEPNPNLILSGNTLYGSTGFGGASGFGTLFAVNTDGTAFTNFCNLDQGVGFEPFILMGDTLYGSGNGLYGAGAVFEINTNGAGLTRIYNFTEGNDGAYLTGLISFSNTLFGTANGLGGGSYGSVFEMNTNGTGFNELHIFTNGNDGENPTGIILSGNALYGTANGGTNGSGTVFRVKTDGTGFTILYSFSELFYDSPANLYTNSDGAVPNNLCLSGNTLYGTAFAGGTNGGGTVFKVNTDGTGFTTLYAFVGGSAGGDEPGPLASPILSGNTLYGTTSGNTFMAGGGDNGIVYALSLPYAPLSIPLTIHSASNAVVLNWTNASFILQSATSVSGIFANVPGATSPYTNIISGTQEFFRLISE